MREQARDVAALCLLHDFGADELRPALNLVATYPALRVRDTVHAATARGWIGDDEGAGMGPGRQEVHRHT